MTKYLDLLNLKKIILIGLFFRLLAAIFSKGYAFTDDHFEIVELAQNLLDKTKNPFTPEFLVKKKKISNGPLVNLNERVRVPHLSEVYPFVEKL